MDEPTRAVTALDADTVGVSSHGARSASGGMDDADARQGLDVTREHKLALIIGFAVLLVVAVLFGEHFSKSRSAPVGTEVATAQPEPVNSALEPGAVAPLPPVNPLRGTTTISMDNPGTPGSPDMGAANPNPAPIEPMVRVTPDDTNRGNAPMPVLPNGGGNGPAFVPVNPDPSRGGGPLVTPPVNPPVAPETTKPALPVSKGKLVPHPVARGESMYQIARKYYNDGKLAEKLAAYNKGKVGANMALREGVTLRIPPRDVLMGEATLADGSTVAPGRDVPGATGPTPGTPRTPTPAPGSENPARAVATEYVVKSGDTLGQISQRLLGTKNRAKEIIELNRGVIADADDLKVGMKLKIPAR